MLSLIIQTRFETLIILIENHCGIVAFIVYFQGRQEKENIEGHSK